MKQKNTMSNVMDEKLTAFIESGVAIVVATRNATLQPHLSRAWAGKLSDDKSTLTLYLPTKQATNCLDDLARCNQISAVFSRPSDYVTVQLKGQCVEIGPSVQEISPHVHTYWQQFMQALIAVGIKEPLAQKLWSDGITPITINITHCYSQTPGPNAGNELHGSQHAN